MTEHVEMCICKVNEIPRRKEMTEHIELTKEQKSYIKEHFTDGEYLFDWVQYFEKGDTFYTITFTPPEGGVIVNQDLLCDLEWVGAYSTSVEIEFKRRKND